MLIEPKLLTIIIFVVTYAFIIKFYHKKSAVVWTSVLALLLFGILTLQEGFLAIDWNVILLYFGMLFVSEVFLFSKMPDYLATFFASKARTVAGAMVIICAFTGFISIFLENVAVVLLVAPLALSVSKKCNINPVNLFIGIAISSNLQGVATLIGDPPSMLLAGFAKLNFNDFFILQSRPSIFFAVQIGAVVSLGVLYFFFRKRNKRMPKLNKEKYMSLVPTIFVLLLILSLIVFSFIPHNISYMNGLLCLLFGWMMLMWYLMYTKAKDAKAFFAELDWQTGVFLIGIFIIVASLSVSGILEDVAHVILYLGGSNEFVIFMIIIFVSVFFSAFVDNVPFLVAMLPVTQIIINNLGSNPYLFYFGLLIGASVGGNITPIGASANIVAMGIMKKKGHHVSFMEFVRIGLPFTIASVAVSAAFVWFVFS